MFEKTQVSYKNDIVDKRTYEGHYRLFPTSLLVNQMLARSISSCEKKIKIFVEQKIHPELNRKERRNANGKEIQKENNQESS